MEKILIFIKHHLGFIWRIIEKVNEWGFSLLFSNTLQQKVTEVFQNVSLPAYQIRELDLGDMENLRGLLEAQSGGDLEYFKPHKFDLESLRIQKNNASFLMMGVWDKDKLIGYFFLRFFMNRKCFVGRLIDKDYRGKGVGRVMNNIMYETAWKMNFRCLSTISKNNKAVIQAHSKNQAMKVLKELSNDYLLVEFVKKRTGSLN